MSQVTPIAIVGMSCRLSGNVSTLDDFWTLLSRSRDGWCPVPSDRISSDAFYDPNPQKKGCFNQKGAYFMKHDFAKFDAPFFHISEQEAVAMGTPSRIFGDVVHLELTSDRPAAEAASRMHV
jgi:acyl transferase domain-containing protein